MTTTFKQFCDLVAAAPGGSKTSMLAKAAADVFADYEPANWFEVQSKAIPAYKGTAVSRLTMAPELFDEGICNALFTCWVASNAEPFDPF